MNVRHYHATLNMTPSASARAILLLFRISSMTVLLFDTETTGTRNPEIIEAAWLNWTIPLI